MEQNTHEEVCESLVNHINEYYGGQFAPLAAHLDNILYMLFFLEEEAFTAEEVQNEAVTIRYLRDALLCRKE